MLFHPDQTERLAHIADRLNMTTIPSAALLYAVLNTADRAKTAGQGRAAAHVAQLIECGAWTEAALELRDLCCPRWQLSRLMYDSGEWHCRLSSQRELPDWLGQTIETRHEYLAVALLKAIVEAARSNATAGDAMTTTPLSALDNLLLCEDFS